MHTHVVDVVDEDTRDYVDLPSSHAIECGKFVQVKAFAFLGGLQPQYGQ